MTDEELTDLIAGALEMCGKNWSHHEDAAVVLAALREANVLPVWRTIDSAPRDEWIWICDNRYKPSESSHLIAKWHPQLNCWQGRMNTKGRFTVWHEATHWKPLPTPPENVT